VPDEHAAHPFYGTDIFADQEQAYIAQLLKKYRHETPSEELKKKIWDDLSMERYYGRIHIPFRLSLRADSQGKFPPYIEIILDTKV
jgi:hypothetical protein